MFSRDLTDNSKKIIDPVIQRNSYFGHCENIILAMMFDARISVRKMGMEKILQARALARNQLRKFTLPILNFNAKDYYEIITWDEIELTEPPILSNLSVTELEKIIADPDVALGANVKLYPCHTQAVERGVKVVTEASASVCGVKRRDGFIRNKYLSRAKMPKFESKCDYK